MKLVTRVLDESVLDFYKKEIHQLLRTGRWRPSTFNWDSILTNNIPGACLQTYVSKQLQDMVVNCIAKHLPAYSEIDIQHYVWQLGSGIALHNDANYKFSATIYLNEKWSAEWGGLFVWREKPNDIKWNAIIPTYNTMIVNDESKEHFVTLVSPHVVENRITLQIRGA